jgi:hypothetical protein
MGLAGRGRVVAVYHQMGHHSKNLVSEPSLAGYAGAILSPVNYELAQLQEQVAGFSEAGLRTVFDPQLYFPNSVRGKLPDWNYFPSDVDTVDQSDERWWDTVITSLTAELNEFKPHACCSPAIVPRVYSNQYYVQQNAICTRLAHSLEGTGIQVVQTALARMEDLATEGRCEAIASVLTRSKIDEAYLVLLTDREPRRELNETDEIKGAMRLIRYLENAGIKLTVGYTSSDIILWKFAGATACATGKFFNLRRFTPSKWDDAGGGGGQVPYWFEESLLAFLRAPDLIRVKKAGHLSEASAANPYSQPILDKIEGPDEVAWLKESWRHYMSWFGDFEHRFNAGEIDVRRALKTAEQIWLELEDADVLMDEPRNDGLWLRSWRRAVAEAFKVE